MLRITSGAPTRFGGGLTATRACRRCRRGRAPRFVEHQVAWPRAGDPLGAFLAFGAGVGDAGAGASASAFDGVDADHVSARVPRHFSSRASARHYGAEQFRLRRRRRDGSCRAGILARSVPMRSGKNGTMASSPPTAFATPAYIASNRAV